MKNTIEVHTSNHYFKISYRTYFLRETFEQCKSSYQPGWTWANRKCVPLGKKNWCLVGTYAVTLPLESNCTVWTKPNWHLHYSYWQNSIDSTCPPTDPKFPSPPTHTLTYVHTFSFPFQILETPYEADIHGYADAGPYRDPALKPILSRMGFKIQTGSSNLQYNRRLVEDEEDLLTAVLILLMASE